MPASHSRENSIFIYLAIFPFEVDAKHLSNEGSIPKHSKACLERGRETFEYVLSHSASGYEFSVIVLSRTLGSLPSTAPASTQLCRNLANAIDLAEKHEWVEVGMDGGQVVQSFLNQGLPSERMIMILPGLLSCRGSLWDEWPNASGNVVVWMEVVVSKMTSRGPGCVHSTFRIPEKPA